MKKIEINDLKRIQLQILDYIDNFCKKNDIKYWLDSGTLLGAARHKGYIPWDDDIDIGMLRKDYEKFKKLFNINNTSNYKLHCIENDKNWYYPFGKILDENTIMYEPDKKSGIKSSVFVDLFVYDNAPDDDKELKRMYKKRNLFYKLNTLQVSKHFVLPEKQKYNLLRYPIWLLFQLFPRGYFIRKSIKNSKKYNNKNTKYIGNFSGSVQKIKCEKELFQDFIELEFEGKMYPAPIGYKEWLTSFYGDYMKLPPKENQVSHHRFEAYYKDNQNKL